MSDAPSEQPSPAAPVVVSATTPLEVFLVPLGPARHELYCEVADAPLESETADDQRRSGWFPGLRQRFRTMMAAAEAERAGGVSPDLLGAERGWARRVRDRVIGAVAEAVAEQRLLWSLRRQTDAVLVHPEDLSSDRALELLRASLRADGEKHRRWLVVDLLVFVTSGVLAVIPGPNLIAYYFAFRLVGHYLSLRGASQGLVRVRWQTRASAPLAELRGAVGLSPADRAIRLHDLSQRLELRHLAAFVERLVLQSA